MDGSGNIKRSENLIYGLCEEIDQLTKDCEYWEQRCEKAEKKYNDSVMTSIRQSQAMGLGMIAIATGDKELAEHVSKIEVK